MSEVDAIPGSTGRKIIDGLKDAVAGNFASVTIEGQRWIRADTAGWQPIETAPKDGTKVLLWTTTAGDVDLTEYLCSVNGEPHQISCVQIGSWDGGNASDDIWDRKPSWEIDIVGNPTHWMLLPAAPEAQP